MVRSDKGYQRGIAAARKEIRAGDAVIPRLLCSVRDDGRARRMEDEESYGTEGDLCKKLTTTPFHRKSLSKMDREWIENGSGMEREHIEKPA